MEGGNLGRTLCVYGNIWKLKGKTSRVGYHAVIVVLDCKNSFFRRLKYY